jgi:hypothetical protein
MFVVLGGCCSARVVPPPAEEQQPADPMQASTAAARAVVQPPALTAAAVAGVGGGPPAPQQAPLRAGGGRRGATWEQVAFTDDEQRRLEAVKADLRASKRRDEAGLLKNAAAAEQAEVQCTRDSLYWVSKYMEDAAATAVSADPVWGPEGQGLSPLAAVAAAKWRLQVREQQAARLAAQKDEEKEEAEAKVLRGMEQLLGKGAARAWAEARKAPKPSAAPAAAQAAPVAQPSPGPAGLAGAGEGGAEQAAAPAEAGEPQFIEAGGDGAVASALTECIELAEAELNGGTGLPQLAQELGARTDLQGVLADVAAAAEKRGLPRRLSRKASLKLTKEVNRR